MEENQKPRFGLLLAGMVVSVMVAAFLSGSPSAFGQGSGGEIRVDLKDVRALYSFYNKYERNEQGVLWWEKDSAVRDDDLVHCAIQTFLKYGFAGRTIGFYVTGDGKRAIACVPALPPLGPPHEQVHKYMCGKGSVSHLEPVRLEGTVSVCKLKGQPL